MYKDVDPLQELADVYDLPAPPDKGSLDLTLVLGSEYFFS
jgi:DNA-directed RNA polymerase